MTAITLHSQVFHSSISLENGTSFCGERDNQDFAVTFKPYGTIVTVFDASGDNHLTFEYGAFSIVDIAVAEYLARSVLSSIKFSDRKPAQLIKNIHSVNNYTCDRIVHFKRSTQVARELYNSLD